MNSVDEVLARLRALRANDVPTHGGRTLSYVYDSGLADADTLGRHALADFGGTNGLDPTAFPSLLAMENDLVAFAGDLLDAESGCAGTVTSGGTESILLAVKAARDASAVVSPAMVLPATAHAAFHKAAHYFGVRPVVVDVDPVTFRADPDAMRAAVDDSTVLLVGSAPSYAHGVIDPIAAIAAIGADRGIRVHVDACIGGWVLPFLPDVAPWTFAVPGVTSISVDLHKYGYSPKGVSILLHRNAELRRSQFFATADWPGYTMLNTTIQSTKSGGPLAAAWAVATFLGREGYADLARTARQVSLDVAAGVTGLRPLVAPDSTLLALVASDDFDVYTVADEMAARGWLVQPQLPYRGGPASLHLSLCAATAPLVPELLGALADSVAVARAAGPVALDPGLVAVVAALDPSGLDAAAFDGILAMAGMSGGAQLPERMAMINALLGEASSQLREALLLAFLDRLTRPERLS